MVFYCFFRVFLTTSVRFSSLFFYSFQVPDDPNVPYDMLEVVKKVVDEGVVTEIMPNYAKNIICGFARMEGRTVGVSSMHILFVACLCVVLRNLYVCLSVVLPRQEHMLSHFSLLYYRLPLFILHSSFLILDCGQQPRPSGRMLGH